MPRTRRLDVPGVPQHVVQRGNNRQPCFFSRSDHLRYLQCLADASGKFGCRVHAYVLMTNHVHLLVTPGEPGAVGRMMQAVGRRYVRCLNDAMGRTGTLWEGRYKACLVEDDEYLLTCYRYVELNPVRACMVRRPDGHEWSSYHCNAMGIPDPLVQPHPTYLGLATDPPRRLAVYSALVDEGVSQDRLIEIRMLTRRQRAFGSEAFRSRLEARTGLPAGPGRPGRPRRPQEAIAAKNVL